MQEKLVELPPRSPFLRLVGWEPILWENFLWFSSFVGGEKCGRGEKCGMGGRFGGEEPKHQVTVLRP